MIQLTLEPGSEAPKKKRRPLDPTPRFRPDTSTQLDAAAGCPQLSVPEGHLAWEVLEVVDAIDTSAVEARYSALGQHGYHPKSSLALWVYASLKGIHHATKLARALETDAALKLCSRGGRHSRATLNRFRQQNAALFEAAIARTVELALKKGLLDEKDLAVDSVRLRAHASLHETRTKLRSTQRLAELGELDVTTMTDGEREAHAAKVAKHESAVALCDARGTPSVVLTSPSAGLLKFPSGASAPGHRASVAACGMKERFVVGVLVDSAPNDFGHLESIVQEAKRVLVAAGLPQDAKLQVAADAGYWSEHDLAFAERNRAEVDVLVNEPSPNDKKSKDGTAYFGREHFKINEDKSATCPADKPMNGPKPDTDGRTKWFGIGCRDCPLKPKCTSGERRSLTASLPLEAVRREMRSRMTQPDARQRYNRRIATVEPVFSSLEDAMAFRRVSSRFQQSVVAEILLKILAYNVSRLIAAKRLRVVYIFLDQF